MSTSTPSETVAVRRAVDTFGQHGGILRTSEALHLGIHASTLYEMRQKKLIEALARGVYRLRMGQELSHPDLVTVARKIPKAVICLVSALSFHEITTRIPHAVEIMLPRTSRQPRLSYPPIEVHKALQPLYELGIVTHTLDATEVKIYDVERTLVDCVKYRNQLGTEMVIEALRFYRERKPLQVDKLMKYARTCRVAKVMEMYLDGVL